MPLQGAAGTIRSGLQFPLSIRWKAEALEHVPRKIWVVILSSEDRSGALGDNQAFRGRVAGSQGGDHERQGMKVFANGACRAQQALVCSLDRKLSAKPRSEYYDFFGAFRNVVNPAMFLLLPSEEVVQLSDDLRVVVGKFSVAFECSPDPAADDFLPFS